MEARPRLALVSTGIRRDLLAPLKYFRRFELTHLYAKIEYGDLLPQDMDETLVRYTSPLDLYSRLVRAYPAVIQTVEPLSLYQQPALWACWLAARRSKARLMMVSFENRPLGVKFGGWLARMLRLSVRPLLRRACLVSALNEGARSNLLECGADPARLLRLMWGVWGVDLSEFAPATARPPRPPTVLYAGRLVPAKGIFVLLDALAQLRTRIPGARLLVAGDGAARDEFERRARELGAGDAVELLGTVKHRAMPQVFNRADVVAVPSLTTRRWAEQVGMVVLQAMACGVPVVASRSGALPEYMPDGVAGLLVPENDAPALANAVYSILTDAPLRSRFSQAARAYASAHYDASRNVGAAETLVMEQCVNARRV